MAKRLTDRQVLETARRYSIERYEREKRRRREIELFTRARMRAEHAFKRGLADRLITLSGLDAAEIDRRVAMDRKSTEAFLKKRAAEGKRFGKEVLARQRDHSHEYFDRFQRWQAAVGILPPPRSEAVTVASSIEVRDGLKQATSMASGQNIGRVLLFHDESTPFYRFSVGSFRFAQILWHFTWFPTIDGALDIAAYLVINGWREVWCLPGCGLTNGSAEAKMAVGMTITQGRAIGSPFVQSNTPEVIYQTQVDKNAEDSSGQIDVGSLDLQWVVASEQPFPVESTRPVFITVELDLSIYCRRAQGTLDLFEKDFQANVPGLILTLR